MTLRQGPLLICDADLIQDGFYPAERSGEGVIFRWIGPDPVATVFLPPVPAPLEVSLHLHAAFVEDVAGQVRLSLDRGPWVATTLIEDAGPQNAGGRRAVARLAPGPVAFLGLHELRIDTVRTESPLMRGAADSRSFSLALSAIGVRSLVDAGDIVAIST